MVRFVALVSLCAAIDGSVYASSTMISISWHDEDFQLHPERALYWSRHGALVVADVHLGKAAAFRAAGVPVPEVIQGDLATLDVLLERCRPMCLIIAGDLIHTSSGRTDAVFGPLAIWRKNHQHLQVVLVRGNHDVGAGDPPASLGFEVVTEPFALATTDRVTFAHDPDRQGDGKARICGHLHPSVKLGDGRNTLRARCFWMRKDELVLPAFGRFTGSRDIFAKAGERVFVIGEGEVAEARSCGRISATAH